VCRGVQPHLGARPPRASVEDAYDWKLQRYFRLFLSLRTNVLYVNMLFIVYIEVDGSIAWVIHAYVHTALSHPERHCICQDERPHNYTLVTGMGMLLTGQISTRHSAHDSNMWHSMLFADAFFEILFHYYSMRDGSNKERHPSGSRRESPASQTALPTPQCYPQFS
jgi:hypothetical protein